MTGATADQDPTATLEALAEAGIDMGDVTDKLLRDGIDEFVKPFDKLIAGVESSEGGRGHRPAGDHRLLDSRTSSSRRWPSGSSGRWRRRSPLAIWRKDEALWGGPGPEIGNRLGWLTISEAMLEHAGDLKEFVAEVRADGFTDAALLGMGGSTPRPRGHPALRSARSDDGLTLHVLDSTDPGAVLELESRVDLAKTLFIVSSKSGGTVETLSHMQVLLREGRRERRRSSWP